MQTPKKVGTLDAVNHYSHLRYATNLFATSQLDLTFFQGVASSATEPCDLTSDAFLPDNQDGFLIGCTVDFVDDNLVAGSQRLQARTQAQLLNLANLELTIGGILVCQGPLKMFAGPGPVMQGITDVVATANAGFVSNASLPAPFVEHPWYRRQGARVRIYTRKAMVIKPADAIASGLLGINVTLSAKTARPVAA